MQPVTNSAITATRQSPYCESDSLATDGGILCFFYGTQFFITIFTTAYRWILPWTAWIQFTRTFFTVLFNITLWMPRYFKEYSNFIGIYDLSLRANCPAHPFLLYLLTLMVFGVEISHEAAYMTLSTLLSHRPCQYTWCCVNYSSSLRPLGVTDQVSYTLQPVWLLHLREAVSGSY